MESNCIQQILLVDDNVGTNYFNSKKITKHGYSNAITCASNGSEALDYLNDNLNPDLILLDINMPVMCGMEFLKVLEKSDVTRPHIIVLLGAELSAEVCNNLGSYDKVDLINGKMLSSTMIDEIEELTKMKFC